MPSSGTVTMTRVLKVGVGLEPPFQVSTTLHFLPSRVRAWAALTGVWPKAATSPPPSGYGSLIGAYLLPGYVGGEAYAAGDQVTGVTFILTGGVAAGIGTVEGVRVVSVAGADVSHSELPPDAVVIYDANDGRIVHAHTRLTVPGAPRPGVGGIDDEAFAVAGRVGVLPARAAALAVSAEDLAASVVHRVDPTSRRLVRVRAVDGTTSAAAVQ